LKNLQLAQRPLAPSQSSAFTYFRQNLQRNAIQRLEQNKARLTKDEAQYNDTSPNNPNWKQLRTLAHRDESLRLQMVSATDQFTKFFQQQSAAPQGS
jgi:hypothetical protein